MNSLPDCGPVASIPEGPEASPPNARRIDWRGELAEIASLGSQTRRPGSLAGLHETRREHLGQFFTPDRLVAWIWRMVSPAIDRALERDGEGFKAPLLDNSCGTGALLRFADPARHELAGNDVHAPSVEALGQAAEAAGFACHFVAVGMEHAEPTGYSAALINPPFSLHLEAPTLTPGFATCYGRFGPDTSAASHAYALQQALAAADLVAAVLPRSYADGIASTPDAWPRLVAVFHAPGWCFRDQGADVRVSVAFFGREPYPGAARPAVRIETLDDGLTLAPDLGLEVRTTRTLRPRLRELSIVDDGPTIATPVTGNPKVRIGHSGRRLSLQFSCGLVEAKVRNAILADRLIPMGQDDHRYPKGVRYSGQGALDIEVHLVQPDPMASLEALLDLIRSTGARLEVDPGLLRYVAKRARRLRIERTPFRHTVFVRGDMAGGAAVIVGTARKTHLADPKTWGAPVIKAGAEIAFCAAGPDSYRYRVAGRDFVLAEAELHQRFAVLSGQSEDRWETVHPGRLEAFPERARDLRKRAAALGLDRFLSWGYQLDDLLELSMARGGICAWAVGLGKARLSVALVLMSGCKAGLICTEAYLIDELRTELGKLGIDPADWQIVESPEQLRALRRINIMSYNRLRSPIAKGQRATYASRLRRRIGCLVADEGDLLRNKDTAQTAALWQISAKRRYVLSGTPLGNYPRDGFAIVGFTGGDATAAQPYGVRRWFLTPELRRSTLGCVPGVDRVRERFVTLEWVTNEFKDDMTTGAKREVPKLRNLHEYRAALAPHIKRRVAQEPDVARHFRVPVPERIVTPLDWDDAHLAFYLEVAEDFRRWYLAGRGTSREGNLVALLARIRAVQLAAAIPQRTPKDSPFRYGGGLTTKQRYAADRLISLAAEGHKTIAFAEFPELLEIVGAQLDLAGVEHVTIHGGKPIGERTRELNARFRFGSAPVLLASLGVAQKGLNLHQADRTLFLTRSWTAKTEDQAEGRVLRPQQTRQVVTEFVELQGSIDAYQRQLVEHKRDAIDAGLDWGTPELADVDFLHLDTILGRFVEDLATLMGCRGHEVRERLAA